MALPALNIRSAAELKLGKDMFIKTLLVGASGSGKTTSACTAPGKKLLLDIDQGENSVRGLKNLDILTIDGPEGYSPTPMMQLKKAKDFIKEKLGQGKLEYSSIILDSGTRLYEYALSYAMAIDSKRNEGGTPTTNHWMIQKRECQELIEFFLNAPFHFICTMHVVADKDDLLGTITYQPAITGKDAERITRRFKDVYRCTIKPPKNPNEKAIFMWRTIAELQWPYLKSQLNQGQKYWTSEIEPSFPMVLRKVGLI